VCIGVLKIANFRYHGNRGWCDTNFICTVKFADPENPMFCARIVVVVVDVQRVPTVQQVVQLFVVLNFVVQLRYHL